VTIVPGLDHADDLIGLYDLADLQIDTFPFGGWTTNLDALHAGVPIVSQAGETGRERWGTRFLEIAGVDVGRAHSDREYVEAAVALASNDALRREVAMQIRRASALLFDGPRAQAVYERTLLAIIENGEDAG
jgi:predicted O-linked N-acetylglucosamine transferase (SPINDLY family)